MANRWGISEEVERCVLERDTYCVYCGIEFLENDNSRKTKASWEHIVNDVRINGKDNVARCCSSCNASKGAKTLELWLQSGYCKTKNITSSSVAKVVREVIENLPRANY